MYVICHFDRSATESKELRFQRSGPIEKVECPCAVLTVNLF